ncbi:MAG: transposase family protein, partial [Eubacterium sp.]|nr:transposase family protein [Eubacterium sp.]
LPRKEHKCPVCGEQTDRIHDYRKQRIKAGEIGVLPVKQTVK